MSQLHNIATSSPPNRGPIICALITTWENGWPPYLNSTSSFDLDLHSFLVERLDRPTCKARYFLKQWNNFVQTILMISVARAWNSLPTSITALTSLPSFKRQNIFIYQIIPISLIFLLVICVPCPRSYCSLCHVNLYVLLTTTTTTTSDVPDYLHTL